MRAPHYFLVMLTIPVVVVAAAYASSTLIPARVQAQLLTKAAEWDRSQVSRAATRVVLLAAREGDPESLGHVKLLARELEGIATIAGGPHREEVLSVRSAAQAIEQIKARGPAIVYLSSGLDGQIAAIAEGLTGTTVLTVGGVAGYAELGAVLGFEAVSGRVQLVVNLGQSRKQSVAFRSALLTLARVIR